MCGVDQEKNISYRVSSELHWLSLARIVDKLDEHVMQALIYSVF